MKKLLAVLFALLMVLCLAGCGNNDTAEPLVEEPTVEAPTAANTYADLLASDGSDELELLMSVQGHESWWDGKVTVYAQSDEAGYLVYEMACDEATAEKLVPGTLIKVKGYKGEWSGEIELTDATCEIMDVAGKVYDAEDLTALIGDNDKLAEKMNVKAAFKNLTVVDYSKEEDKDGYLNVTDENGTAITFVVRRYLTNDESEVAKTVSGLVAGDVVDIETFLYWYEGPQARIIDVVKK